MIRKLYKRNIKHIAFDLDGVLIDSIALMEKSWIFSMKKLNLNYKFIFYKKYLGYPFIDILCKMKIPVKYHKKISNLYSSYSKKNYFIIKKYKDVDKLLKLLQSKHIKISIVTSKNKYRTNAIIKKFFKKSLFDAVITPESVKKNKGKPNPDSLLKACKEVAVDPYNTVYVGDMKVDVNTAYKSDTYFIFAKWGYGKLKGNYHTFKNINEFIDYIIK